MFSDFPLYFDRQGNPISRDEAAQLIGDMAARRVALEYIRDGLEVSTVHLVINHGLDPAHPLIFETMVFEEGKGEECFRWSTEEEAIEGHRRIANALREVQKTEEAAEKESRGKENGS